MNEQAYTKRYNKLLVHLRFWYDMYEKDDFHELFEDDYFKPKYWQKLFMGFRNNRFALEELSILLVPNIDENNISSEVGRITIEENTGYSRINYCLGRGAYLELDYKDDKLIEKLTNDNHRAYAKRHANTLTWTDDKGDKQFLDCDQPHSLGDNAGKFEKLQKDPRMLLLLYLVMKNNNPDQNLLKNIDEEGEE